MKNEFYSLTKGWIDWKVMLPDQFERDFGLVKCLNEGISPYIFEYEGIIPFDLVGRRTWTPAPDVSEDEFRNQHPYGKLLVDTEDGNVFREILSWAQFIKVKEKYAEPPFRGWWRIISGQLKDLLEKFELPHHVFYPVDITHEITRVTRRYYLFHLPSKYDQEFEEVIWEEMEVNFFGEQSGRKHFTFSKGELKNFTDFEQKIGEQSTKLMNEGEMVFFKGERFVYSKPYDLLGIGNEIVVSNALNEAIRGEFGDGLTYELEEQRIITGFSPGDDILG